MKKKIQFRLFPIIVFGLMCLYNIKIEAITLVEFGSYQETTTFGLSGWDTVLKSSNLNYTSQGNGGLIAASDPGEYGDYRGISGTPRSFSLGERITVTWTNNSDESFFFTARISFIDNDEPNGGTTNGPWYTMRSYDDYRYTHSEIFPYSTARTVFNITDSGVHKTDETFSLVNINLAIEWGSTYQKQFLICEKIELLNDADIIPPSQPSGLSGNVLSDSKILLNWNTPSDNVGVVEYLIYMNGEIEGYSRSNSVTSVFLEPENEYTFSVSALDAAGNESIQSDPINTTTQSFRGQSTLINPAGFEYLGVIVLPEDYNWGGEAIAYNCDGDGGQSGSSDGYPGSIYATNLNQQENGLVGEINIPVPRISTSKNLEELNQAVTLVQPVDIRPLNVNNWGYVDIWRTGLEYIADEGRLYSSWSIHYTVSEEKHASISCCDASDLAGSTKYGAWYLGDPNAPPLDAMMCDWLFSIPQTWADVHCSGRSIITGRCRDGGLSGLGPTLYGFSTVGATPPEANSVLEFTTLLEYGSVAGTENYHLPNAIDGYNHSDDWRETLWINIEDQNAIAVIGNKALGHNWYGYHGERMHNEWVSVDIPNPEPEFVETDPTGKGWRSHNRQLMIIFYDPADLADVASELMHSYEPQPYAALRIDNDLFYGSDHEIFSATFDSQNGLLYVTEFVRELEGRLILHTWNINPISCSIDRGEPLPSKFKLYQNYPNPFNPKTIIKYQLPITTKVELCIYNMVGQKISTLVSEKQQAGNYTIEWVTRGLTSGIYLVRFEAGDYMETKKMIVQK